MTSKKTAARMDPAHEEGEVIWSVNGGGPETAEPEEEMASEEVRDPLAPVFDNMAKHPEAVVRLCSRDLILALIEEGVLNGHGDLLISAALPKAIQDAWIYRQYKRENPDRTVSIVIYDIADQLAAVICRWLGRRGLIREGR